MAGSESHNVCCENADGRWLSSLGPWNIEIFLLFWRMLPSPIANTTYKVKYNQWNTKLVLKGSFL